MTMIERVARAFCRSAGLEWDNMPNSNFDGAMVGTITRLGVLNGARAAIEAMREMTPEMFDAAGFVHGADDVIPFWEQVIDAALEIHPE